MTQTHFPKSPMQQVDRAILQCQQFKKTKQIEYLFKAIDSLGEAITSVIDSGYGLPSDPNLSSVTKQILQIEQEITNPQMKAETRIARQERLADLLLERHRITGNMPTIGHWYLNTVIIRHDDIKSAINSLSRILTWYQRRRSYQECLRIGRQLGNLLYERDQWVKAYEAYAVAAKALEEIRLKQSHQDREQQAKLNADLYARLVSCCLERSDQDSAFRYALAAKGRVFVDMLATVRFDLSAPESNNRELATDLRYARELRQQIDRLRTYLIGKDGPTDANISYTSKSAGVLLPVIWHKQLHVLQDKQKAHWDKMAEKYPKLTATQKAPAFSLNQACVLAEELEATLVSYYCHAKSWCAFVVTRDGVRHVQLPQVNDKLLKRMSEWTEQIESFAGRGVFSYGRPLYDWHEAVIAPLRAHLPKGGPLILAPFGRLHLLPLAVARDPTTKRYVAEEYRVAFVPSLSALHVAHKTSRSDLPKVSGKPLDPSASGHRLGAPPLLQRLLSVAYPCAPDSENYLPNVLAESKAIARYFPQVKPLHEDLATPDAVIAHARDYEVIHLGCHGWFDPDRPEHSGLLLSGGWLTVQRIMTELHLSQTHLVTLGACLSGRTAVGRGDHYVGLMQAVMTAGARTIVASLWNVDDAATRALFEAFYQRVTAGHSPAEALRKAAQLVRQRPAWKHPYYWGAFTVNGLAHNPLGEHHETLLTKDLKPIERINQESKRTGKTMSKKPILQDAKILLTQITNYPDAILAELTPVEGALLVDSLAALSKKANNVQNEAHLLAVANAVYTLVEEIATLRVLLLEEGSEVEKARAERKRTITQQHHENQALADEAARVYAPVMAQQLGNAHNELDRILPKEGNLQTTEAYRSKWERFWNWLTKASS